jgi:hypothetical protein
MGMAYAERDEMTKSMAKRLINQSRAKPSREKKMISTPANGVILDERTAAGRRDLLNENLGHTNRARSHRADRLFKNKAEASPDRVKAIEVYDSIWHSVHKGLRSVDWLNGGGGAPGYRNILPPTIGPRELLNRIHSRVGPEGASILYHRVILHFSFKGMERQGFGDERDVRAQFVVAVDGVARLLGFKPEAESVRKMREALASTPGSPL